jgi:hypothetical protein
VFGGAAFSGRKSVAVCAGAFLALMVGPLAVPAQAAPVAGELQPIECPAALPAGSVTAGVVGRGWTVVTGSTPEPFNVEVLGVLTDGIGAGRDLIMIKVSDLTGGHVIDQGGGIWEGMSGSPVYVDGKLLGAVSYGFTYAPSAIGGLTPAADMLDVLNRPAGLAHKPESARELTKVKLSATVRRELAAKAGVAPPRGTLQQLVTPLAVSGLGPRRITRLQTQADAAGWSVKAYAAGKPATSKAPIVPTARPHAGGNFAAMLSYGDVTAGGIGTTTAVCGDRAVAFGHPLNLAGPVNYGASDAPSVTIVKDDTFGSFKMSNIGADFGTVDQDRLAAIRANLGAVPNTADITTIVRSVDTGKKRTGTTRVADQTSLPELVADAALANYDSVFDEIGDGTATSNWTITGRRAGDLPFSVSRSNQWASQDDAAFDPALDVAYATDALVNNDFEKVTIDTVTFGSDVATTFQQLHLTKIEVAVNGGKYHSSKRLVVKAGAKLKIRVSTRPYRSTATTTHTLKMTVPKKAKGQSGSLSVLGGVTLARGGDDLVSDGATTGCLLDPASCSDPEEGSLDKVIKDITSAPRNDTIVAQLNLDSEDDTAAPAATKTQRQKLTVIGQRSIDVRIR